MSSEQHGDCGPATGGSAKPQTRENPGNDRREGQRRENAADVGRREKDQESPGRAKPAVLGIDPLLSVQSRAGSPAAGTRRPAMSAATNAFTTSRRANGVRPIATARATD